MANRYVGPRSIRRCDRSTRIEHNCGLGDGLVKLVLRRIVYALIDIANNLSWDAAIAAPLENPSVHTQGVSVINDVKYSEADRPPAARSMQSRSCPCATSGGWQQGVLH